MCHLSDTFDAGQHVRASSSYRVTATVRMVFCLLILENWEGSTIHLHIIVYSKEIM